MNPRLHGPRWIGVPRNQRGAVLYIALIMLILLALIGIVGMQVATLQERMSANYVATNVAFQNAESQVRTREIAITDGTFFENEDCSTPFDPKRWAESVTVAADVRTVNIGVCMGECSAAVGGDSAESLCNLYRTTGFSRDQGSVAASSSLAAIDTIFIKP
ncbi:MAG: PilX N-terminal domain-containing pilus assembly protein [Pseudoxanthomonas sp.]